MKLISQRILNYPTYRFDLDKMDDDECKAEFRFLKNDIYTLCEVLDFPEKYIVLLASKYLWVMCVPLTLLRLGGLFLPAA